MCKEHLTHACRLVAMPTVKSNSMSMYLPNRLELSFLFVLALPKASRTGLDCRSLSLTWSILPAWPLHWARYLSMYLEASEGESEGGRRERIKEGVMKVHPPYVCPDSPRHRNTSVDGQEQVPKSQLVQRGACAFGGGMLPLLLASLALLLDRHQLVTPPMICCQNLSVIKDELCYTARQSKNDCTL